ncbi:MAG TPA: DNA polymerase III subunit gamma/tau [Thermoanaerobaculales bacterium]|nr:DNA polymerase III subunit gamma/tau [Thermoanaerobaculales bacterium]HQL28602.1 DNA polymerase III subunit gamma/tau [Thermoanaerobaculales bacterium]
MTYQVLARAWRPQRFEELLGQDAVVQTLRNALASGTLGHAYLFSGLRGVGKTTAARLLAKAVNCAEGPTPEPCGHCVSCREIADGSSLDAVEIDGATHTKVDEVRDLQELLRFHPTRDRFRVVIVDEVHMLSKAAFNALLKSIEEPPPYVLWVFATTERHKVPATILSRCQQLEFRPVATERIAARLLEIAEHDSFELAASAAESIARAAEGSVRDALSLLDQLRAFGADRVDDETVAAVLGVPRFEVMVELLEALAAGEAAAGLAVLKRELEAGHDAALLYREVGRALRAAVHCVLDPALELALTEDQRGRLRPFAEGLGVDALTRMLGLWADQEPVVRDAGNRELALEVAALRLARWPAVQRLEELLAGAPGGTLPQGGTPGPGRGRAGGTASGAGDPRSRLAAVLWDGQPRLASAVEQAEVSLEQDALVLRFGGGTGALASFASSQASVQALEAASTAAFGGARRARVEGGEPVDRGGAADEVGRAALSDPGVELARRVLGGEIVAVRPDGEPA